MTSPAAQAEGRTQRVRFECRTNPQGEFGWVAPAGVTSIRVEIAGGAGGSNPGNTGRGGKGAVVEATLAITDPIVSGDIGCSGNTIATQFYPGGPGGTAAGAANAGARGGGATFVEAGNNHSTVYQARIYAGGGGGGGGRGSGFGVNAGGDGGDAGAHGNPLGSLGEYGDNGLPGGGAPGGSPALGHSTCRAPIVVQYGQPGQNAVAAGGGGGGGGAGREGGCGGGAGSQAVDGGHVRTGSGGGGQPGESQITGPAVQSPVLAAKNHGDGYVVITYDVG